MLTKDQYLALRKYRDSFVRPTEKPDHMTEYLFHQGFIRIQRSKYTTQGKCEVLYIKTIWELTSLGEQAMEEYENFVDHMANVQTEKEADHKFQLFNTFLSAVLGIIITLIVEHFAEIFDFFHQLFS